MPALISFKDAVNASALDPAATHAVFYMDGSFTNFAAVRARCPHAKLYAITTRGATGKGIFALDSENGDVDTGARGSFPQTETWVAEQIRLNVSPIVVYANEDRWVNLGLLVRLAKYGNRIERWDANFDGNTTLPNWASAKQFQSTNVDLNVAVADFFGDAAPVPRPKGTVRFVGSYNQQTGVWKVHGVPGIGVRFAGVGRQASAELQMQEGKVGGGRWRIRGIPFDSKPLGG
jgi:hypothetical protein